MALFILHVFGTPFKWQKTRGGLQTDWVGLHTDYHKYMLGISQSTAEADWTYAKAWLKREMKNDEGDPHIKGRRRQKQRELAKRKPPSQTVPKADAVIVNPTHIAIAIRYRKGEHRAPIVIARGKGVTADAIRALAVEDASDAG